jgi:hypothetical protein
MITLALLILSLWQQFTVNRCNSPFSFNDKTKACEVEITYHTPNKELLSCTPISGFDEYGNQKMTCSYTPAPEVKK